MPKQNKLFSVKKISKSKKPLPAGRIRKVKKIANDFSVSRRIALVAITMAGMWIVYNYEEAGHLFKASVLEAPAPFDGTVYPADRVPDWTHWNGDNHNTHYNDISPNLLTALPEYDLSKMQFANDNLEWGNHNHDHIRNTKITYPVVYLGNYQLDHKENAGSHLAVDIKMPVGTPLKSIANGRVVKSVNQSTGFGNHVVIQHQNVPDPDSSSKKTTLYSGFSHMERVDVHEGQIVTKGQVIGTSGDTGTATTPHLHFQIDKDSAPWHPYWPFSYSEAQAAGLSFFEAVNAGLGLSNARQHTVNPMAYVAKHLNYQGSSSSTVVVDPTPEVTPDPEPEPETVELAPEVETETEAAPETEIHVHAVDTSLFDFNITGERTSMVNNGVTLTASLSQDSYESMGYDDEIEVVISGVGRLNKKTYKKNDFSNRAIKIVLNSSDVGTAIVQIGRSSHQVAFIEEVKPIARLRVENDGYYQRNQVEILEIVALDDDSNPTPVANFAGLLMVTAKEGNASFSPDRLGVNDFKNGVAQVRMTVSNEDPVKVRVQNGAIVGESSRMYAEADRQFTDISKAHPNYKAIKFLSDKGIVSGYSDGTFRANQTVNRVEALKMLMLAFNIQAGPGGQLPFNDTDDGAWYATTLATAVDKSIVKGYQDGTFRPSQTVNKAEYLKMLFETNGIKPSNVLVSNPYDDVPTNAWYSGYAYLLNRKNLLDVKDGRLDAGNGMTRGDVAETIYRLKTVIDGGLLTYGG